MTLEGKEVNFKTSKEALENGVAMVHQELNQALNRDGHGKPVAGPLSAKMRGICVRREENVQATRKALFEKLERTRQPHAR